LLFKSGLHLAYDGPATPTRRLMAEIAQAVRPKVINHDRDRRRDHSLVWL
jgi:hypothetical protein